MSHIESHLFGAKMRITSLIPVKNHTASEPDSMNIERRFALIHGTQVRPKHPKEVPDLSKTLQGLG